MSGTLVTLAVKAGAAALKDKRTWTVLGTILCAFLVPFILILMVILSMADGAAEHNRSSVLCCFDPGMAISTAAPAEFVAHITAMRNCFAAIDAAVATLEIDPDDGTLDVVRIKAICYGLFYEQDTPALDAASALAFAENFVTYEERTREVEAPEATPAPEEDADSAGDATGTEEEEGEGEEETHPPPKTETYKAAIPISSLRTIFQNVARSLGRSISLQDQSKCMEIYYIVVYGDASRGDNADDLADALVDGTTEYAGGPAGSPFAFDWHDHVTSEFGGRVSPITGKFEGHRGLDMRAPYGTPIRAVASGTVILARYGHASYGNYLVIDHGGGTTTLYAHCSALTVAVGQQVNAGDVIAKVGSTGDSTGNHLHLEVKINGQLVDPRTFLS